MGPVENLIADFTKLSTWEEKYRFLIEKGRDLGTYPEEFRQDKFKVKGCQSQVWLYPEMKDGKITFYGDSDATIVKGIMAILLSVYSDKTPGEILAIRPTFIEEMGLREHLSMSRANGLYSMLKQMGLYAVAFQHQP